MMRQPIRGGQRPDSVVPGQQPLPQYDQDRGAGKGNRKRRAKQAPIIIDGAVVERVESFKFLGVHITNELSWSKGEEGTRTPFTPQKTENIWHGSPDPPKYLQLHHQEHPDRLHPLLVWHLLCI